MPLGVSAILVRPAPQLTETILTSVQSGNGAVALATSCAGSVHGVVVPGSPAVVGVGLVCCHIELQVKETVIGGIQDAEPVSLWLHLQVWVGSAVDHGGVHEGLTRYGGVRIPGLSRRSPRVCVQSASGGRSQRLIVFVRNGSDLDASHREPIDARRGPAD